MQNSSLKNELEIIADLKVLFESSKGIGIGDDTAVINGNQLVATDAVVENVHFIKNKAEWKEVAYKLFASNASDIAAMGGIPISYTLALSLPKYWKNQDLQSFISGIRLFFKDFPGELIGGDLVRSNEFFASVTVIGKALNKPWLRSSAQKGDFIYCTGTLGDSKLWLDKELKTKFLPMKDLAYFHKRHYYPTPRLDYVSTLNKFRISSAIDISDGLVEDLIKLCRASEVNFYLDADSLPLNIEKIGKENFQEHQNYYKKNALIGGEDYELLFTSPEILNEEELQKKGIFITQIGRILSAQEISKIFWKKSHHSPDEFRGFQH
ncbi:MAG: thiamine-phosphate kinase [Brevinemataceae bacterium]